MRIAVIALSSGLGELYPNIVRLGALNVQRYSGYAPKIYETAQKSETYVWDNPKKRAEELNEALADEEILYVHSLIGGFDSVRTLIL